MFNLYFDSLQYHQGEGQNSETPLSKSFPQGEESPISKLNFKLIMMEINVIFFVFTLHLFQGEEIFNMYGKLANCDLVSLSVNCLINMIWLVVNCIKILTLMNSSGENTVLFHWY